MRADMIQASRLPCDDRADDATKTLGWARIIVLSHVRAARRKARDNPRFKKDARAPEGGAIAPPAANASGPVLT